MGAEADHAWLDLDNAGSKLQVEDFLSMRLDRLSALLLRRVTQSYLAEHGLSLPEWRLLSLLARLPQVSATRINSESSMDKGQISRGLVALEQRGFVRRVPDPADGRSQLVALTAEGRRRFARIIPVARRRQAALLGLLTVAERKALLRIFDKITQAMEQPAPAEGLAGSLGIRPAGR